MFKKLALLVALVLVVTMLFTGCGDSGDSGDSGEGEATDVSVESWPTRPINLIIPFGAGGGTDVWSRALGAAMEETLGVKVLANNMTGGGPGGTGTSYVWNQPHDGYAIAGTSETPLTIPVMTMDIDQTAKDWEFFIAAGSPGLLLVNANSGYSDLQSLIEAANEKPNEIKIASTAGGLWFLLANLLPNYGDVPLGNATYDGSRPSIVACVSGETAAVAASAGEVADFIKSGDLIPLAVFDTEDYEFPGYGNIEAITKFVPQIEKNLPLKQWLGFKVPVDTPDHVKAKLTEAFAVAMNSQEIKQFAEEQYAVIFNITGEEASKFAAASQSNLCWQLFEMGMTERNPEDLGIPKP